MKNGAESSNRDFRVAVLGTGRQGAAALWDLASWDRIADLFAVDRDADIHERVRALPPQRSDAAAAIRCAVMDIGHAGPALVDFLRRFDLVVDALPGSLTLPIAEAAAEAGTHVVNSMYLESPEPMSRARRQALRARVSSLGEFAVADDVTILPEFGLDPGLDLVLASRVVSVFDSVEEFRSYGAGLPAPEASRNPLRYKFSWTPGGVMKAYNRPAVVIRNGEEVRLDPGRIFHPAELHSIKVDGMSEPLECYPNGDGVPYARQLGILDSVKEMGRYTCRYPGHSMFWEAAAAAGFLAPEPVVVGSVPIPPQAFTAELLSRRTEYQYGPDERDLTYLRVDARGMSGGRRKRVMAEILDFRDPTTGFTSMQRTVGFTLAAGARGLLSGRVRGPGIVAPSTVDFEFITGSLAERGIRVRLTESELT